MEHSQFKFTTFPHLESGPTGSRGAGAAADFFLRPTTLTAGSFEAVSLTDSKFLALKDIYSLKSMMNIKRLAIILG